MPVPNTIPMLDLPDRQIHHYVFVKNLSHLVKYSHNSACHICLSCLQMFSAKCLFKQHLPNCLMHAPQQCAYLTGKKAKQSFDMQHFEFPFDLYLVRDLKCFLMLDVESLAIVSTHTPSAFIACRCMNSIAWPPHLLWQKHHAEIF